MNKDLRNMLVWMVFASVLVVMAFWQAQVTVAREAAAKNKVLPPPAKTRHAIRPAPVVFTGDPVADYIARCEKGLTDQEIGWILEDFHNAGLDLDWRNPKTIVEELVALRATQHRWYHDALVDALRLNSEQSAEMTANLDKLFDTAKADFMGARKTLHMEDEPDSTASSFVNSNEWLLITNNPFNVDIWLPFQPWKLCQLTREQKNIFSITNEKESATGNFLKWDTSPLPKTDSFPFLDPFFAPDNDERIANLRALNPSQLKLILLHSPGLASEFQSLLERQPH